MKISVIIPCYNCTEFLRETIESLEKQTYTDFEVICVNDGSTDGTKELLQEIKETSKLNLNIINQENKGVSRARNVGIEAAKGEHILFLDADDIYNNRMIEKLASPSEGHDVVYCRLSRNLEDVYGYDASSASFVNQNQTEAMNKLLFEMGRYGFYCYSYKKEILEKNNLRFDENTKHFEDREFNWKYLCHCNNVAWVDAPLYGYRINNASVTRREADWQTDGLEAVKRVEIYLKENNCPFTHEVESYLYARMMWAVAKTYSKSRRKDLFKRLCKEYDVRTCMKRTARDNNRLVTIASVLFLIHPLLFYYCVGAINK